MSGPSHVPIGADPKIKEIMTSLDDDKIGKYYPIKNCEIPERVEGVFFRGAPSRS